MKNYLNNLTLSVIGIFLLMPVVMVALSLFQPYGDNFYHIVDNVLQKYLINSIVLALGVACLTFLFGVVSAWLVVFFNFPGRKIFSVLLFFPLAVPAYVAAFLYGGFLEFAGPLQSFIREFFDVSKGQYFFPSARNIFGGIIIMSLVFYPYVYMFAFNAFRKSTDLFVMARNSGAGGFKIFWNIGVRAARPAIIGGVSLAVIEALADFGAVQYLAIDSFTTAIYRSWYNMADYHLAAKLALMLLVLVLVVLFVERASRAKIGYQQLSVEQSYQIVEKLTGIKGFMATAFCSLLCFFAFILPVILLVLWSLKGSFVFKLPSLFNTLLVASLAAFLALIPGFIFAYILRFNKTGFNKATIRMANIGYVVPGSVAAVGVVAFLALIDSFFGVFVQTSLIALLFAYIFRFLAISSGALESGFAKINDEVNMMAKMLPVSGFKKQIKIYLPMMSGSVFTAFLLVFVEVVKELPATLIIRPFNFDTLAIDTYILAADERLYDAASPALLILTAGILPVILLVRRLFKS